MFVNGTLNPSVKIRPGQLQRWRIFNANNNRIIRLNLSNQPMWVLAEDGNTLPRMRRVRTLMIAPGSRREILVRGSRQGTNRLTALPFAQFPGGNKPDLTSKGGGPTPDQTVLRLRSSGPAANDRLPRGPLAHPVDLRRAHVDRHRNIAFSEAPDPAGGTSFKVNGAVFDHHVTPITMKLGSVEEWRLLNTSSEWHTFHIHQNPFQTVSVNGHRLKGVTYEDNVAMPPCHIEPHPADPADPALHQPERGGHPHAPDRLHRPFRAPLSRLQPWGPRHDDGRSSRATAHARATGAIGRAVAGHADRVGVLRREPRERASRWSSPLLRLPSRYVAGLAADMAEGHRVKGMTTTRLRRGLDAASQAYVTWLSAGLGAPPGQAGHV